MVGRHLLRGPPVSIRKYWFVVYLHVYVCRSFAPNLITSLKALTRRDITGERLATHKSQTFCLGYPSRAQLPRDVTAFIYVPQIIRLMLFIQNLENTGNAITPTDGGSSWFMTIAEWRASRSQLRLGVLTGIRPVNWLLCCLTQGIRAGDH